MEFKKLTKDLLEEAAKCKTDEEREAFIKKHNIQLPDEVLNKVSGGSGDDYYVCETCGKRIDSWWDYQIHFYEHLRDAFD